MIVLYEVTVPGRPPTYPITAEWQVKVQVKVRKQLERRGARAALARTIGCSYATITGLLSPEARHSHLIPAIHRAFGWSPPEDPGDSAETEVDPPLAEWIDAYERLSQEQIAAVLALTPKRVTR